MKIGIVGGGFAGLATAAHLARNSLISSITIFDRFAGPGVGGASSVSAGLLHPFSPRGGLMFDGMNGYNESVNLINDCEKLTNEIILGPFTSINRVCRNKDEAEYWQKACNKYPELLTYSTESISQFGSASIRNGKAVNSKKYLQCLWKYICHICNSSKWSQSDIRSMDDPLLEDFDAVLFAPGSGMASLWSSLGLGEAMPYKFVKGRSILHSTHSSKGVLSSPILCGYYMVPFGPIHPWNKDQNQPDGSDYHYCLVGSTHEHISALETFQWNQTSINKPSNSNNVITSINEPCMELIKNVEHLCAQYNQETIIEMREGVRVASPRSHLGRLPEAGNIVDNQWIFTGLGSKGLIYHALIGKYVAEAMVSENSSKIPTEFQIRWGQSSKSNLISTDHTKLCNQPLRRVIQQEEKE